MTKISVRKRKTTLGSYFIPTLIYSWQRRLRRDILLTNRHLARREQPNSVILLQTTSTKLYSTPNLWYWKVWGKKGIWLLHLLLCIFLRKFEFTQINCCLCLTKLLFPLIDRFNHIRQRNLIELFIHWLIKNVLRL